MKFELQSAHSSKPISFSFLIQMGPDILYFVTTMEISTFKKVRQNQDESSNTSNTTHVHGFLQILINTE